MLDNPDLLPNYELNWAKDERWNKQYISNLIKQNVIDGTDIRELGKVLERATDANFATAIRTMRTAATSAQNGGRIDVYKLYNDKLGLNVKKEWLATMDSRVRHSHKIQDGEIREVDKKFSNGCLFPADPNGEPCEVYNCRCTLVASFDEKKNDMNKEEQKDGMFRTVKRSLMNFLAILCSLIVRTGIIE